MKNIIQYLQMTYFVVSAKGELNIFQISSKNALYHWLLFNKLPHMSYIKKFYSV